MPTLHAFIPTASWLNMLAELAADDDRNFVKKAVSMALRAIGKRNASLEGAAVAVAARLAQSPQPSARWIGKDASRELAAARPRLRGARRSARPLGRALLGEPARPCPAGSPPRLVRERRYRAGEGHHHAGVETRELPAALDEAVLENQGFAVGCEPQQLLAPPRSSNVRATLSM
ncbi:DNA alkylation repair protein [Sorangium sp. So ce281]